MAIIIDGKKISTLIKEEIKNQVEEIISKGGRAPHLAAVLVGYANFMDPERLQHFADVELTIHDVETYIGILIGAITLSGSIIAFGKLSGKIGGNPMLLPARHFLNLS